MTRNASRHSYLLEDTVFSFCTVSLLVFSLLAEFRVLLTVLAVMFLTIMTSLFMFLSLFTIFLVVLTLELLLVVMALIAFLKFMEDLVTLFSPRSRYILLKSYTNVFYINKTLQIAIKNRLNNGVLKKTRDISLARYTTAKL